MKYKRAKSKQDISLWLDKLIDNITNAFPRKDISKENLKEIVKDALSTKRLINDLAELYRLEPDYVIEALQKLGLNFSIPVSSARYIDEQKVTWIAAPKGIYKMKGLSITASLPAFIEPFDVDNGVFSLLESEWKNLIDKIKGGDSFLSYYRTGILAYLDYYFTNISPKIHTFIEKYFKNSSLKYIITVGIGANEQFLHFPQSWYQYQNKKLQWFICDNPKDLSKLPLDCNVKNTLFIEYSRSGKTQEIVKFDEFLISEVVRIIFANSGPLFALSKQHKEGCLNLDFPEKVPGRFGKNMTPLLLVPFDLLGLPVKEYWNEIAYCINSWDLSDPSSPPAAVARYIRAAQLNNKVNHIYLGCNDDMLLHSCDEMVQFWNEGVNKDGNDISMSRYFGLPRDSHLNIEGILSNRDTKIGIFLLRKKGDVQFQHPLRNKSPKPVNPEHNGLNIADVDYALALANADHFGKLMPTIKIEVEEVNLLTSAVLSQLWADITYSYSLLIGVNPGSNPEVRLVRDRSEILLAEFAKSKK
ncbi:MAG: hypothetical protein AB1498_08185 [bacterium]